MNRKDTTELLTNTLIEKLVGSPAYFATEVTLDYGFKHPHRVDVMEFRPSGVMHVSDIEKGIFVCYEVKSSYEDLYSGNGLNFFGEKNYIVTTMEVAKKIQEDAFDHKLENYIKEHFPESSLNFGVMVLVPRSVDIKDTSALYEEHQNPTPLDKCYSWQLVTLISCHQGHRKRCLSELLFCMLRSKHL